MGVGGCWAQSVKEEVFERFPFVDVAFGPGQVHRLAEFLTSDSLTAQGYFEFEGFTGHLPAHRERAFQGWMQISVGCNCACSYCIVPSTRGREVSRPMQELLEEAEAMAGDGVREVTLLGQNVNSYGRDLPSSPPAPGAPAGSRRERPSFAQLLRLLDGIDGIDRIRYTSPHPKDMREDVILAHAELASVCEHIHLPLQSGSSRILKAMHRTYDRERYMSRVALIREHVPDVALTSDIIVGFPGESEEDFEQTLQVVDEVGYDSAFTFVFSPRRAPRPPSSRTASCRTRSRSSAWAGSSSSCRRVRASAPSASWGGRSRCWWKAARAKTPTVCAGAPATTRSSTSEDSPRRVS